MLLFCSVAAGLLACGCSEPLPQKGHLVPDREGGPEIALADPQPPATPAGEPDFKADKPASPIDPDAQAFLADPVAWLKGCLARQADVRDYTCVFSRKEKPKGHNHLHASTMDVEYRDKPFAVRMRMVKGGSRLAREVLYAEGENKNQMVILPVGVLAWGGLAYRNPLDPEVMDGHRNPITKFGLKQTLERTISDWETLRKDAPLQVRWLGLQATPELDGKHCLVVIREGAADPDDPAIRSETIWIDPKTRQLVGNRLTDDKGGVIAEYWYNKLVNNPELPANRFKIATLK
ncbi:MAG: DUF1571 domain-containing protein [Gemmataceae bacterium]|nr:DUF1571 domain-containing protein [Gemmataceae bacterium]